MKKTSFEDLPSTNTPINDVNLNGMQDNIEESVVYQGSTQPSTNEKVWLKYGKNLYNPKQTYNNGSNAQDIGFRFTSIKTGENYTFTATGHTYATIKTFDTTHNQLRVLGNTESSTSVSFTVSSGEVYFECYFYSGSNNVNVDNYNYSGVQLERGLTATTYEAYIEKEILTKNADNTFSELLNIDEVNKSISNDKNVDYVQGVWNSQLGFIVIRNLELGGIYRIAFSYNHRIDWSNVYRSTFVGYFSLVVGLDAINDTAVARGTLETITSKEGMNSTTDSDLNWAFEGGVQEVNYQYFLDHPFLYINFTNTEHLGDFKIKVERIV